ncbi:MAG: hypothetical protein QXT58_04580 [Archaeoglobaceae archaeon]
MKVDRLMRVVKAYILPSLPNFRLKRSSCLYATPVEMILRAFYFQTSYLDPEAFTVWAFAQPLYVPYENIVLNIGGRLGWLWRDKDIWWRIQLGDADSERNTMQDVLWYIQKVGLPFIESMQTPKDIIYWIRKKSGNPDDEHYQEVVAYSYVLLGDYKRALHIVDRLISTLNRHKEDYPWMFEMEERVNLIKDLLQQSPEAAIQQLREWRNWTLKQLRLEKEIEPQG